MADLGKVAAAGARAGEHAAEEMTRIPANLMAVLRHSYDTREKVLDWLLSLAVVACMAFTFRAQLRGVFNRINPGSAPLRPNEAMPDNGSPNCTGRVVSFLYTNNQGPRTARTGRVPTGTRPPISPNRAPGYLPPAPQKEET